MCIIYKYQLLCGHDTGDFKFCPAKAENCPFIQSYYAISNDTWDGRRCTQMTFRVQVVDDWCAGSNRCRTKAIQSVDWICHRCEKEVPKGSTSCKCDHDHCEECSLVERSPPPPVAF